MQSNLSFKLLTDGFLLVIIKLMSNQKANVNLVLILAVFLGIGLLVASSTPISKKVNSDVQGVYLAKDGEGSGSKSKTTGLETKVKSEYIKNGVKVEFEIEDEKVKVKVTDRMGKELGVKEAAEVERGVELGLAVDGIKVSTGGAQLAVSKNNVGAVSNFPLTIDLTTNQLMVTTPKGTKVVAVLPDQAVSNMLKQGILNSVNTSTSSVGGIPATTKLEEKNDVLVYEIEGTRSKRLFGFIPINTPVTIFVSAETGELAETEQSLLTSIINRLSF